VPYHFTRRLPALREFIKGGEAEMYRNVSIRYVRGQQTILRVYRDGREGESVVLSSIRTKEKMHEALRRLGFERKSEAELEADHLRETRLRNARNLAMFLREEYLRKQELHCLLFYEDVVLDPWYKETTWVYRNTDTCIMNYDKIFRHVAVWKSDMLLYARRYLASR
jgi:hypothetical protein